MEANIAWFPALHTENFELRTANFSTGRTSSCRLSSRPQRSVHTNISNMSSGLTSTRQVDMSSLAAMNESPTSARRRRVALDDDEGSSDDGEGLWRIPTIRRLPSRSLDLTSGATATTSRIRVAPRTHMSEEMSSLHRHSAFDMVRSARADPASPS